MYLRYNENEIKNMDNNVYVSSSQSMEGKEKKSHGTISMIVSFVCAYLLFMYLKDSQIFNEYKDVILESVNKWISK